MYKDFFGLNTSPFHLSPDPYFMISSEKSKEALASISEAILLRKGFVVMTGEVGTGKTLVLRCLFELWEREQIPFAYFIGPRLSTTDFLSYITFELGIKVDEPTKGNLLRALYGFFLAQFERGLTTVLIIDEAHQIPRSVLEEVRLLTNFETAQQKLVQIVLVGQPELDKKLDMPELRSLKQRIGARCHLEPLREEEIRNYIERRLELAGAESQATTIFPPETVKAIYRYSRGIPRLVNSICDQSLIAAHARQVRVVPVEVIYEVASHFRLDPAPSLSQTEKSSAFASQAERSAQEKPKEVVFASNVPATKEPAPDATLMTFAEGNSTPVEMAPIIKPEASHENILRHDSTVDVPITIVSDTDATLELAETGSDTAVQTASPSELVTSPMNSAPEDPTPHQQIPEEKIILTSETHPPKSTQESAPVLPARVAAPLKAFQPAIARPVAPSADGRMFFKSEEILHDSWMSQIRRWLQPGLRLAIIISAVVLVPAALATGVYVARHQKPAVTASVVVASTTESSPLEQTAPSIQPVAATSASQADVGLVDSRVNIIKSEVPKPPSDLNHLTPTPHTKVVMRTLSSPVLKTPRISTPAEPPSIGGMQPTGPGLLDISGMGPISPGSNVISQLQPPRLLSSTPPTYPSIALTANVRGAVLIDAVVDEMGKVTDMKVISGPPLLKQAAMDALRTWKYSPARLNGRPTPAHLQVRIDFNR